VFLDRFDAGKKLAQLLVHYANRDDVVVLGIPRGGVPVAFEVAQALHVPLDILLVRKLGTPGQKELAMGAIASGGVRILNQEVVRDLDISEAELAAAIAEQEAELQRREQLFRGVRPAISVRGKTAILVDDGIATGSSMLAAVQALRALHPKRIVVATPVAPPRAEDQIKRLADEFVCIISQEWFFGIGEFYRSFPQTQDVEVQKLLGRAAESIAASHKPAA
jgi:putative phosphoribosyl transferase